MAVTTKKAQVSLPSDSAVMVTRRFNAPRALVYRAYSEPALLRRWNLGPPGWTMSVCEMAMRVGSAFRWRWRSEENGAEFGFTGVMREVDPGVRVVHTQRFDPGTLGGEMSEGEALVTVTFADDAGGTLVTTLVDFGTKAARDDAVGTGMTDGMEIGYQRLDEMFASGTL